MKAVLFDLDNTLYPEAQFVRGGFAAVARSVYERFGVNPERAMGLMVSELEAHGRGRIFDALIERLELDEDAWTLVGVYREHHPHLELFADAAEGLAALRDAGILIGVVTDGNAAVQHRKVDALGLDGICDAVVVTEDLGPGYAKPSQVPFEAALRLLDCPSEEAAYVADDPSKDFVGPRALGMATVMVDREVEWGFSGAAPNPESEAQWCVPDVTTAVALLTGAPTGRRRRARR